MEVASLIELLPERFDNMKISFRFMESFEKPVWGDLVKHLITVRPKLIFDQLDFRATFITFRDDPCNENLTAEIQNYLFEHARSVRIYCDKSNRLHLHKAAGACSSRNRPL